MRSFTTIAKVILLIFCLVVLLYNFPIFANLCEEEPIFGCQRVAYNECRDVCALLDDFCAYALFSWGVCQSGLCYQWFDIHCERTGFYDQYGTYCFGDCPYKQRIKRTSENPIASNNFSVLRLDLENSFKNFVDNTFLFKALKFFFIFNKRPCTCSFWTILAIHTQSKTMINLLRAGIPFEKSAAILFPVGNTGHLDISHKGRTKCPSK